MSLNRVRCRLSFNSPKEQQVNVDGTSPTSSLSSIAADTAVKEQVRKYNVRKYIIQNKPSINWAFWGKEDCTVT